MNYTAGLVSVIIPTYKRSDLLPRAIQSVLGQTYRNVEVLVVNDNVSPDDEYSRKLYALLDGIDDGRVRLVSQPKHINAAAARNAGIREAVGEYIAFLDDDDYWEPEKVELQVRQFERLGPRWGMVTCLNILRNRDRIVGASFPYRDGDIFLDVLERRVGIGMGSALFRRSALDVAGYFDERLLRHQDLQLFANVTARYRTKLVRKHLFVIDVSDGQNRPDAMKLQKIKQEYFDSVKPLLERLSPSQRRQVVALHDFETAYSFLKSGDKRRCLQMAAGILRSPVTVYLAAERCCRKLCEKKLYRLSLKKYSDTVAHNEFKGNEAG